MEAKCENLADGHRRHSRCVSRTYLMELRATRDVVFPLLCPVREAEYLNDWNAEILYSESGVAEEGCVFPTQRPGMAPSIWTITKHNVNEGRIEFVVVTPKSHVTLLRVDLADAPNATTDVTFTYTHRAIADAGREFIMEFTENLFHEQMTAFEDSLNAYLDRTDHDART